jgi:hypothetical protein
MSSLNSKDGTHLIFKDKEPGGAADDLAELARASGLKEIVHVGQ